ncbi:c-type cytochrome [Sphingobium phenoxybenzoativorans]|uniref:C-type cytochrome n=1 Tax=Sphingobium phenoxybenzoativorans TaxID=1592790 RepID=A0A975K9W6_9SPHN|nr:c-type cytochrome [Sphingobium phenoxybenzoativorans]QUT07172.1 c-type cytochrome [Sphingobium phenoxybenzoativorans]
MFRIAASLLAVPALILSACGPTTSSEGQSDASQTPVERGQYLVSISGCHDCHTVRGTEPIGSAARPNLAGSDSELHIKGLGVFVPPNITPDRETGLGGWTEEQIADAIQKGLRPDGRILSPAMPWEPLYSHFTREDALAVAAYLKSIPAVHNRTPDPRGPDDTDDPAFLKTVPRRDLPPPPDGK